MNARDLYTKGFYFFIKVSQMYDQSYVWVYVGGLSTTVETCGG